MVLPRSNEVGQNGVLPKSATWNLVMDEIEKAGTQRQRTDFFPHGRFRHEIDVANGSTNLIQNGQVVKFKTAFPLPSDDQDAFEYYNHFDVERWTDVNDVPAVVSGPNMNNENDASKVTVFGITTCFVNVTDLQDGYVEPDPTQPGQVRSTTDTTPIRILFVEQAGSQQPCKVLVNSSSPGAADELKRVTCAQDMLPGGTYVCDIQGGSGGSISVVFDWIDDEQISAGKEIIVGRFRYEESGTEIWRPVSAQCEDNPPIDDIGDRPVPPTLPFEFDGSTTIEAAGRITTGGVTNISAYAIIEMSVAPPTSQHWVVCENNTGGGASNNRQWALTVKTNGTVGALIYSSGATTPARNYETIATLNADTQYKIGMQWTGGDITILIDDVPQTVNKIQDNPVTVIHDGNAYFQSMGIDAPNTRLQTANIKVTEVSMSQDGTEQVNWKPTAGSSTVTDDSGNGNNGTMVTIVP